MRPEISAADKIKLAICAAIFFFSHPATATETVNIVALIPGEGQLRNKFIATEDRLEAGWHGDVDVVLLVDGQIGTEESMISTVRRGRSQFSMLSTPGTSAAIPEMSLLMAPYLFDSFEEADFVLDSFVTEKAAALFADKGLHFIQWIDSGWFNVFSQTAIRTPQDTVGQRMRAAGGPAARVFLQLVGADVAQLPFSDLVPGLQTGLLSGGATNTSMYRTVALYELAPFITLTRHGLNPAVVFANKTWFDGLPKNNQDLVMAGIAPTDVVRRDVRAEGADALVYAAARGATVIELTVEQRKAWKDATAASHRLLIDEIGGQAAEVYELIQDGKSAFAAR
jgi:TRAP-type C4-dicarboxylate transport system substrate-binding protein